MRARNRKKKEEVADMKNNMLEWRNQAILWEFLAFSLRYPQKELAQALSSGEYLEAAEEIVSLFERGMSGKTLTVLESYKDKACDDVASILRVEATRLFVGAPVPLVSPYEGVWRAEDEGVQALLFVNPYSRDVEHFYRMCGVKSPEGSNEPLDHVAVELEFLQYLALIQAELIEAPQSVEIPENDWPKLHESFLEEHVQMWMPRFAERLIAETHEPFYKVVGQLLGVAVSGC